MPNYRNRNKKRKNKNRNQNNNNNNQNQNNNSAANQNSNQQQQKQQQQPQQQQRGKQREQPSGERKHERDRARERERAGDGERPEGSAVQQSGNVSSVIRPAECRATALTGANAPLGNDATCTAPTDDTVLDDAATQCEQRLVTDAELITKREPQTRHVTEPEKGQLSEVEQREESKSERETKARNEGEETKKKKTQTQKEDTDMGLAATKLAHSADESPPPTTAWQDGVRGGGGGDENLLEKPKTPLPAHAKIIIHRIVNENECGTQTDATADADADADAEGGGAIGVTIEPEAEHAHKHKDHAKVIIHRIEMEGEEEPVEDEEPDYCVDSPKSGSAVRINFEEERGPQIQEIHDLHDISDCKEGTPPVVSEAESDAEGVRSPVQRCEETRLNVGDFETLPAPQRQPNETDDAKEAAAIAVAGAAAAAAAMREEEDEKKIRRWQKRVALENHFMPQMLSPRYLDSIMEENSDLSDSRSDEQPVLDRRHSSDDADRIRRKHQHDQKQVKSNAIFPRSSLDFSKSHKHGPVPKVPTMPVAICEEPTAVVVEVKYIDQLLREKAKEKAKEKERAHKTATESEATKVLAKGQEAVHASLMLTPESETAEVVYINSASSSASDLLQLNDDPQLGEGDAECSVPLDTDVGKIMRPPSPCESSEIGDVGESRESTPVNRQQPESGEMSSAASTPSGATRSPEREPVNSECEIPHMKMIRIAPTRVPASSAATEGSNEIYLFSPLSASESNSERPKQLALTRKAERAAKAKAEGEAEAQSERQLKQQQQPQQARAPAPAPQERQQQEGEQQLPSLPEQHSVERPVDSCSFGTECNVTADNSAVNAIGHSTAMDIVRDILHSQTALVRDRRLRDDDIPPPIPPPPLQLPTSSATPSQATSTPVPSDSATLLNRQESCDSHCSDGTNHSTATAIHVDSIADAAAASDTDVESSIITVSASASAAGSSEPHIKKLRLLCTEQLAGMPYGQTVLEELASVAQNIAKGSTAAQTSNNMPYPLPVLPHIGKLQLATGGSKTATEESTSKDSWLGMPTKNNPKVLVCLSPAQRAQLPSCKQQETADALLDAHEKFMERRGYDELNEEQLKALSSAEERIVQTAVMMRKLRKNLTPSPPPPLPPPPVPAKSSETAAKAQQQQQQQIKSSREHHDASLGSANEQPMPLANGEAENIQHRLLAIIHPDQPVTESGAQSNATSSLENNSRRVAPAPAPPPAASPLPLAAPQPLQSERPAQPVRATERERIIPIERSPSSSSNAANDKFPAASSSVSTMQSVESELGRMFPTMGATNIFDPSHRRFSSFESSSNRPNYCSQILATKPTPANKRYSNIETRSYESQQRIENGQVVYDTSNSKHETQRDGEPELLTHFPLSRGNAATAKQPAPVTGEHIIPTTLVTLNRSAQNDQHQQQASADVVDEAGHIMSALKLNSEKVPAPPAPTAVASGPPKSTQPQQQAEQQKQQQQHVTAARDVVERSAKIINRESQQQPHGESVSESERVQVARQARPPSKADGLRFDQDRLFSDFDELSKQLHQELERGKSEREQRERSASLFDLHRAHLHSKDTVAEWRRQHRDHLRELEQEIERSMHSRRLRSQTPTAQPHVVHQITVQRDTDADADADATFDHDDRSRFRRAESMYNISDTHPAPPPPPPPPPLPPRPQTPLTDDWARYASDLGSSENIVRPFAREVEICYQRQRQPRQIRAPRMSVSTNDLSSAYSPNTYDSYNAYNARRTQQPPAPMQAALSKQRPLYTSCHSMIERDPNPTYISTTTRRGVSPAPHPPMHTETETLQRRASLPHEIQEQQLRYIQSKEEELRTEIERLQSERRRLVDELNRPVSQQQQQQQQAPPAAPQRAAVREIYRSTQKLPTLSEDEVFRQQMAEEWLNKVGEREQRRLQKILKISQAHDIEPVERRHSTADINEEFLSRVKERRSKLHMPSDSDWESGAESQPHRSMAGYVSEGEELPPIKIVDGKSVLSLNQLPQHLREFARFSNHEREQLESGHREVREEEERRQEATANAFSSASKKTSFVKTFKIARLPATATFSTGSGSSLRPMPPPQPLRHASQSTQPTGQAAETGDGYQRSRQAQTTSMASDVVTPPPTTTRPATTTTTTPTTCVNTNKTPHSPIFSGKLPVSFTEMFAESPFKNHIYEEFDKFWRNFENS